jgi:hypothetical protein
MLKLFKFAGVVFGAAALLSSCKGKDGEPGPVGPAGPAGGNLTGSIVGFVNPIDEFSRPQTKSGVTVTLENATPTITTTTDANGRYELTNVKSGTYNIAYSKAGYGTYKVQGYPHAGGDQPAFLYSRDLIGLSATTVPTVTVGAVQPPNSSSGINDYAVPVAATLANPNLASSQSNYSLYALIFVGSSAGVTSSTGTYMGSFSYFPGQTSYPFYLSRAYLNQRGFTTGSTAYAVLYGAPSFYSDYGYTDLVTGRGIYTSLNTTPSRVVSFIVP